MRTTQKVAQELFELLVEAEKIEFSLTEKHKQIGRLKAELNEAMDSENVDKISIRGIEFKPIEEQSFALTGPAEGQKWDDSEIFFKWLKEQGEEGLIKVKETVPWNTRKKFLKEWVENKQQLPDFIKESYFETIKFNKSAIKRLAQQEIVNGKNDQ